jgi:hypothetical protein
MSEPAWTSNRLLVMRFPRFLRSCSWLVPKVPVWATVRTRRFKNQEKRVMTRDEPRARIAVVGSTMIDLVAFVERIPDAGETLVGRRFQMGFGGKGANQAVMASLLGADVAMVNCLGDDAYGDLTLENFD